MSAYVVRYRKGSDGWWLARTPKAPRIRAHGRSVEEARRNFREKLGVLIGEEAADEADLFDDVRLSGSDSQDSF